MATEPLVLTRPATQAESWAQALRERGVPLLLQPLIVTTALPEARGHARLEAEAADWVFFSSPAAVTALFDRGWAWPAGRRAVCVGPGTAAALREAGVPADLIVCPPDEAEQFDSERLWPLLQAADAWRGRRMLLLRGDGGRDWLMQRLREAGAEVMPLSVYRRSAPQLDARELTSLRELLRQPALWLFSSSEALDHLQALAGDTEWASLQALVTHPRIAERAGRLGMQVQIVRPQPEEVAAAWSAWCNSLHTPAS